MNCASPICNRELNDLDDSYSVGDKYFCSFICVQSWAGNGGAVRGNKYNAQGVTTEDGHFDSGAEYKRWLELKLEARAGLITDLKHHVVYPLDVNGIHIRNYEADFVYYRDGALVVEDVKGVATETYQIKAKLMLAIHGITVKEIRA